MNKLKLTLLEIVRLKAATLQEGQQIRLLPEMGYNLYKMNSKLYIGYSLRDESDKEDDFFPKHMFNWINVHFRNDIAENLDETVYTQEGSKLSERKPIGKMMEYNPDLNWVYREYFRNNSK